MKKPDVTEAKHDRTQWYLYITQHACNNEVSRIIYPVLAYSNGSYHHAALPITIAQTPRHLMLQCLFLFLFNEYLISSSPEWPLGGTDSMPLIHSSPITMTAATTATPSITQSPIPQRTPPLTSPPMCLLDTQFRHRITNFRS